VLGSIASRDSRNMFVKMAPFLQLRQLIHTIEDSELAEEAEAENESWRDLRRWYLN